MKSRTDPERRMPGRMVRHLALAAAATLGPIDGSAIDRIDLSSAVDRICNGEANTCIRSCYGKRGPEGLACHEQCRAGIDPCRRRESAGTSEAASGPALDADELAALAREIDDAVTRQRRTAVTGNDHCRDRMAGMIRDPYACLKGLQDDKEAARSSEREPIVASLAKAEASLTADVAALPSGLSQVRRYTAMERLNAKYRPIVLIARDCSRDRTIDAHVQAACQRFENKRLTVTGGQDAARTAPNEPVARPAR